jgi:hypothetical protein
LKAPQIIGWPGHYALDQGGAIGRNIADGIALFFQCPQYIDGAGGGIQADAIAEAPVTVGIVGQDQGDTPFRYRFQP